MKKRNRFIALLLSFTMLISMIPASALTALAAGYYDSTLEGVILTADGTGVADVSVFVYDITEKELVDYYSTNSIGKWSTDECVSGNKYLVSYYHRDYTFSTDTFIVDAVTGTLTLDTVTATKTGGDYTESDTSLFTYEIINGNYIKITSYTGNEETVVIPSEIDGYTVQAVGNYIFEDNTTIKKVVFPSTVESIGNGIFYRCTNLQEVELSAGLESIGNYAFYECKALTDIDLPNTLTSIGDRAFYNCTGISEVILPDSITHIGGYAFACDTNHTSSLSSINFPLSWTTAGDGIFYGCSKLTSIEVPEGVIKIPNYAFSYADYLVDVSLPSTLQTIGNYAFYYSDGIKEIVIPDSVTTLGNGCFYECKNLSDVTLSANLTTIGDRAFYECDAITDITLPDGLLKIGDYAFYSCNGLTSLHIPDTVTTIYDGAFSGCENLSSINIPLSWTTAGTYIFSGCSKLKSITVPEGIATLPNYAFYGADCLTQVVLPSTLQTMGNYAFYECVGITSIELPDGLTTLKNGVFSGCDGLTTIHIPDSVTTMNDSVFSNCENLSSINIPLSWTTAGTYIFSGCSKLKSITVPEGIATLPKYAFYGASIKTVSLPNSLTTIGNYAFYDCSNLRYVDSAFISLTTIKDGAFSGCERLRSLTLSDKVSSLGSYVFDNCPLLTVYCPEHSYTAIHLIDDGVPMEFINNPFKDSEELALDRNGTYYVANTVSALSNGYVTMNLAYKFKDDVAKEISNMSLTIRIPSDLTLIEKTLMLDGVRLTGYDFEDNVLTISITNTSGQLSFCLNPTKDSKVTTYAVIDYTQNGVKKQEIIGVLNDDIPLLTVQADSEVNESTVSVSGVGPADTDVSIYIDGVLANTVHTNKSGSYVSKVTITDPKNYNTYTITAKASTDDGDVTATKAVKYCVSSPTVQHFTMDYNGNSYDMTNQGTTKPTVNFVSGKDFNFNVKFTNPEQIDTVYICSTRSNVTKRIEAVWNEKTQSYVATGLFDPSNTSYVPGTITVEYSPIRDPINFLTGNIDYTADKYVNGASDPIRAALAGKLEDCIEDLESDDNKVSGIIKLIDVNTHLNFNIFTDIVPSYLDPENAGAYGYEAIEDDLGVKLYLKVAEDVDGKISGTIVDFAKDKLTDFCIEGGYIDLDMAVGNYFAFVDALGYMDKMITWDNNRISINESKQAILSSNMSDAEKAEALKKLDYASKSNNGVVAAMALQIILGVAGVAIPFPASMILPLLSMRNSNYVDDVLGQFSFLNASETDGAQFTFRWAIDPSGYVYEGVTNNRIEGVKTTVYHIPYDDTDETFWDAPKTEKAQLWDASEWDQVNPLFTDLDGKYAWDVPEGWWQVKFEKEGYETTYSEWLPVPPPQTEVNIGLTSTAIPTVESVEVNDGSVVITFSQYIDPETFNGIVLKDADGNNIGYTVEYSKDETDLDGNVLAKVFTLKVATGTTVAEIEVPDTITNYAGKAITSYSESFGAEEVLYGDVTGDGVVNNKDVTFLRRYLIGGWDVTIDTVAADVNKDGSINNKDVTLLRRYLIGGWNVTLV